MELNMEKKFPFELNAHIDKARLLQLDIAKSTVSGDLNLSGNLEEGLLQGELTTHTLHVTLPEETSAMIQTVNVIYINQPEDAVSPIDFSEEPPFWPLKLALKINVPKARVKANNLKSYWEGGAEIKGSLEKPLVYGVFKITEGSYIFRGKTFALNEGTITCNGDLEKDTTLYVIGSMKIGRMTVEAILRGPIGKPELSFRSNPPMSQREILSWILFGHGLSNISPLEGSQLNETITDLDMADTGPDLLTKIQNTIGIDRIDIGAGDGCENAVSVKVGKYLSQGTLVSVGKNMSTDANTVSLEMDLFRDFKLEANISDDDRDELNLIWRRDY